MTYAFVHREWIPNLRLLAANLAEGKAQHRELRNAGLHIQADYHGRFLVELLQNANDQAVLHGLTDSRVVIVRTPSLIAVANQGVPFDDAGLSALTSLALSSKDPEVLLGNKGLGFKSVYDVSRAPEIYSVAPGGCLANGAATRLTLSDDPLAEGSTRTQLEDIAASLLRDDPDLAARLRERYAEDAVGTLVEEIRSGPPWKFPVPLPPERLEDRLRALNLLDEARVLQTVVVLPLIDSEKARKTARDAFEQLVAFGDPSVLFLPGIGTIRVLDQVNRAKVEFSRRLLASRELARGARQDHLRTTVTRGVSRADQDWWRVTRTLGDARGTSEQEAAEERRRVNLAARDLPGRGWSSVERATVSVALRREPTGGAHEPNGHFCIGLPTRAPTGSAFWIDAHFHANVPRTQIDFDFAYNDVLLEEAVSLVHLLVEERKRSRRTPERRVPTCCLARSTGPLGDRLWAPDGLAQDEVVLTADRNRFVRGVDLLLPRPDSMELFELVSKEHEPERHGFRLPEPKLLRDARDLLVAMGAQVPSRQGDRRFVERSGDETSLLEQVALASRSKGARFWERFLELVLVEYGEDVGVLGDQRILPVGTSELACPDDRIFLEPIRRNGSDSAVDDDADVQLELLPENARAALRLLDSRCLPPATGGTRSALPKRLVDRRLVLEPRKELLVNEVIGPRLQALSRDAAQRGVCMALLQLAVHWIRSSRKAQFRFEQLRVPVLDSDGSWSWVAPSRVYLGAGWVAPEIDVLLHNAFGHRPRARLVPWTEFRKALPEGSEGLTWWLEPLRRMGVLASPALITSGPLDALWHSTLYGLRPNPVACPIAAAKPWWSSWLRAAASRRIGYSRGSYGAPSGVTWIDGLEDELGRQAVFDLLLLSEDEGYARSAATLTRRGDTDPHEVPSLWAFALERSGWRVVRVENSDEPVGVRDAWLMSVEEQRHVTSKLVRYVPERLAAGHRLLERVGVQRWGEASLPRLVRELHAFSLIELGTVPPETAEALAGELYEAVQRALEHSPQASLDALVTEPVPVVASSTRRVELRDLRAVDRVFVNDAPYRARFVVDFPDGFRLPAPREPAPLVAALRKVLGSSKVQLTSEADTEIPFRPDPSMAPRSLLDELQRAIPDVPVVVDLAMLVAFSARPVLDPAKEEFARIWARFRTLQVQYGTFHAAPDGFTPVSFYDRSKALLSLMSSSPPDPCRLIEELWYLAGPHHRDVFAVYAHAVRRRQVREFFVSRGLEVRERLRVEEAIGKGAAERYLPFRSVLFAIWRVRHPGAAIALFEDQLTAALVEPSTIASWLCAPELEAPLAEAVRTREDDATLLLLTAARVSVPDWQARRVELGLARHRFEESARAFAEERAATVARLKSAAARRRSSVLPSLEPVLRKLADLSMPDEFGEAPRTADDALRRFAELALRAIPRTSETEFLVRTLVDAAASGAVREKLRGLAPEREVASYLREDGPERAAAAAQVLEELSRVSMAVAAMLGEPLHAKQILSASRLTALSSEFWANRFVLLAAMREVLEEAAPKTVRLMSDRGAFKDVLPLVELWSRFRELGPLHGDEQRAAPRIVHVLGQETTEENVTATLRQGSSGAIGARLASFVNAGLDLRALASRPRAAVAPEVGPPPEAAAQRGSRGRGQRGGSRRMQDIVQDQRRSGVLGEAFVYEQLRRQLPGFDCSCWRSENAMLYGTPTGDDGLGYDFRYVDGDGAVTGRQDKPICLIEVKASTGSATDAFVMSEHEWDVAARTNRAAGRELYMVFRVAEVQTSPRIADIIVDPVDLYLRGRLHRHEHSVLITVGAPD